MPDFIEQAMVETKDGSLTWLMGALGIPDYPGRAQLWVSDWNRECRSGMESGMKEGCAMSAVVGLICQVYLIHFFNLKEIHLGERFARVLKLFVSNSSMRRLNAWFCTVRSGSRFWVIKCRLMPIGGHVVRSSITWVRCRIPLT